MPEKSYITTVMISNLQNAVDNGYLELGETDIADLLLLCEKPAEQSVQADVADWFCAECGKPNGYHLGKCHSCLTPRP